MAQLPLAAFTSPATNPCSWPFGLSVGGCLSDIYCSALIINDGAIGTMGEDEVQRSVGVAAKVQEMSPLR